jgi:hypothetical protein
MALGAGDLNGDGFCDLVAVNSAGNSVTSLVSNGDGTFQPVQTVDTHVSPQAVALADLEGDGNLDLLVATKGAFPNPGGVGVYLGNGNGTFRTSGAYYNTSAAVAIAVGDVNGDGYPDFVASQPGPNVWLSNGDGTFRSGGAVSIDTGATVALADVNGDGSLDVVTGLSHSVKVFLDNGDGTFQYSNVAYATGAGNGYVAVGDFSNDGFPDLVITNTQDNTVSVLINDGNSSSSSPQSAIGPRPPRREDDGGPSTAHGASALGAYLLLEQDRSAVVIPTGEPRSVRELSPSKTVAWFDNTGVDVLPPAE